MKAEIENVLLKQEIEILKTEVEHYKKSSEFYKTKADKYINLVDLPIIGFFIFCLSELILKFKK